MSEVTTLVYFQTYFTVNLFKLVKVPDWGCQTIIVFQRSSQQLVVYEHLDYILDKEQILYYLVNYYTITDL